MIKKKWCLAINNTDHTFRWTYMPNYWAFSSFSPPPQTDSMIKSVTHHTLRVIENSIQIVGSRKKNNFTDEPYPAYPAEFHSFKLHESLWLAFQVWLQWIRQNFPSVIRRYNARCWHSCSESYKFHFSTCWIPDSITDSIYF